jgi:radical SAM protein with 4Fe4S-binding SPASM domain
MNQKDGPAQVKFYLEKSDVFCMMPWVHMHSWPDGRVMPCCLGNPDSPLGHLDDGLKGTWNNDHYKHLRRQMLNDEATPDQCQRCYSFDKAGTESLRKTANRKFGKHLAEALANTDADGTYHEFKLRYIDFRYSNQCNLRCRSCCHDLSSSWHEESVKLYGKGGVPILIKPKNQGYLDEVVDILPYVESVYFAGGEPLLQPEHYFLLQKLKEIGNTDVDLSYATNFTLLFNTKYDVLKYWDGFKSVEMMASIDGTHKRGDLMRKNQEWDTIVANRRRLMELKPNVGTFRFLVTATLSAMNAYHLPDIHREWIDLGLIGPDDFFINPLVTPEYYCAQVLPRAEKRKVERIYRRFIKDYLSDTPSAAKRYESALNFINEEDGSHLLPQFVEWIEKLDQSRGERFVEVFPEWKAVFDRVAAGDLSQNASLFDRSQPFWNAARLFLDKVGLNRT